MQIPSFSRFRRSLIETRIFQPKYARDSKYTTNSQGVLESAEKHIFYLSRQIINVDEEINTALLRGKHIPRKPPQWVKKATTLKHQVTDALKEQQNSKNPSLKSEELKHMCEKIFDYLKHCPVEDKYDQPITFIAGMHELEDKSSSYSKLLQSQDDLEKQDVEKKLASDDTSLSTSGCTEKDDTVSATARNKSKTVSFQDYYPGPVPLTSENAWGGETVEGGASSQVHDSLIPEISLKETRPPYIPQIPIENINESEIIEEIDAPEDMVAKMPSLLLQRETGPHRRQEKMPVSISDPNGELASSSEAASEPEMRVLTCEKNSPELEIQMSCSSQADDNKHDGESIAGPSQTDDHFVHENKSDLGMIIPISVSGEMSAYVDLKLEVSSMSSTQETLNLNNSFGLDTKRDKYFFSATKKFVKLELDNQRTLMGGAEPLGAPETSQANIALVPEHLVVNRHGCRSKEMPTDDEWHQAGVVNLMEKNLVLLREEPDCPNLVLLFLQRNNCLTYIAPSFFDKMPALRCLDISNARIRTLPNSLFMRTELQVLMLRSCVCFDNLPPEVKNLRSMEVLDLSGTDLYSLPKEISQLTRLRRLQVSFYGPDYGSGYAFLPSELVSPSVISELQALQELSIVVHPEDQRWMKIAGDIIQDVGRLKMLSYLELYFPTVKALISFVEVSPSWKEQRLRRFKFIIGHNIKRIISRVSNEVESKYDEQDQCLRYVNGNEIPEVLKRVLKPVTAFYLDHHLEIQNLSEFGISNFKELRFCVVRECPNFQVMMVGESSDVESAFPNLEHLGMHYMWELERIWEDPVPLGSFKALRYLMVDTCPKLEYIASQSMLQSLPNLETLIVEDCESLRSIVKENKMVKSNATLLPRLTELVLRHLPQLVTLGSGLCPSEETITIHCCPKLILSPHLGRVMRRKFLGSAYNCSSICI